MQRGIGYFKSYPHARYEDIREKLMHINFMGTEKDHPSFASGCLTDEHIKWIACKVQKVNPYEIIKPRRKQKMMMTEEDLKAKAIRIAQQKFNKEFHPLSQMFPYLPSDKLAALRDNVKEAPPDIVKVYTLGGKVFEGKNIFLVAAILGLKVEFVEYEGNDPIGFLLTRNLHRRHLTIAQRAYVAAQMVTTTLGSNQHKGSGIPEPSIKEVTQPVAAKLLGVSVDSVANAKSVLDSGDNELIEKLRDGKISVNAAVLKLELIANSKDSSDPPRLDEKKAAREIKRYADENYVEKTIDLMKQEGLTDIKALLKRALESYVDTRMSQQRV